MKLKNCAALVTGASRGLGKATATELARAGARVVLTARSEGPLDEAVATVRAVGGEAHGLVSDIGDVSRAGEVAARAAALVGPIDLAIHNASALGDLPMPILLDTSPDNLSRVLAINTIGPFALTRALVGSMLVRGGGTIVNITSDAAVEAYPAWGAYGASKAALEHMTRTWAAELTGTPVRVLAIDPGEMDTRMHRDAMPDADRSGLAQPEHVAAEIVRLLSGDLADAAGGRLSAAPPIHEAPQ